MKKLKRDFVKLFKSRSVNHDLKRTDEILDYSYNEGKEYYKKVEDKKSKK